MYTLPSLLYIIQRQLQTLFRCHTQVSPFTHTVCKHLFIHIAIIPFSFNLMGKTKQKKRKDTERPLRALWSSAYKANNTPRREEFLKLTKQAQVAVNADWGRPATPAGFYTLPALVLSITDQI